MGDKHRCALRWSWKLVGVAVAALALAAGAQAETASLAPGIPGCLPQHGNALVTLTVVPEVGWSSVRVYFRKAGAADFYYLEMRSEGGGNYWAVLPRPENGTDAAEIQFAVTDIDGNVTRSPLQQVDVRSDCGANLSPGEQSFARNLVIGETAILQAGQPLFGWQCDGVVSRIGVSGQLRYDDTCRSQVVAAALGEANHRMGLWVPLAAVGGAVAGGVIIHQRDHETASCYCNCTTGQ